MAGPACPHPEPRQLKGVPAEYAGLCDCCVIRHQAANGILFARKDEREPDMEAGR
jgi:hypothetical protein